MGECLENRLTRSRENAKKGKGIPDNFASRFRLSFLWLRPMDALFLSGRSTRRKQRLIGLASFGASGGGRQTDHRRIEMDASLQKLPGNKYPPSREDSKRKGVNKAARFTIETGRLSLRFFGLVTVRTVIVT
jgi:hypothetical protein